MIINKKSGLSLLKRGKAKYEGIMKTTDGTELRYAIITRYDPQRTDHFPIKPGDEKTLSKYERLSGKKKGRRLGKCSKPETMGKHYKRKSKKHLSEKQKRALAKGRKVLNYLRTGRQVSEPKEPLLIKEGFFMAKKKRKMTGKQKAALARGRKRATAKRSHGFEGFEGKKRRRASRRHVALRGDPGPDIAGMGIDLAGLLAGAIGLSLIASIIPIKNPKFKALIPMVAGFAGLFIPMISGNRFASRAALGSIAIGGYSLTKQLVPKMPLMGAADTAEGIGAAIENLPPEEKAILGLLPAPPNYDGYDEGSGYDTGSTEMISGGEPGEMLGSEPGEMLGNEPGEMLGTTESIGARDDSDFE